MWACLFFVPTQLETRAEENKRTQFKSLLEYWTFCSSWNSMRIEFGGRLCSLYMTPSFLAIRWPKCITNIYTTPVICHFAKIQSQKYIKCQKLNTTIQKKNTHKKWTKRKTIALKVLYERNNRTNISEKLNWWIMQTISHHSQNEYETFHSISTDTEKETHNKWTTFLSIPNCPLFLRRIVLLCLSLACIQFVKIDNDGICHTWMDVFD